jgi:hypothetical protein
MAKTVIVQTICDRCKAEGNESVESAEEVRFSYDGFAYTLDLCAPHAEEFHNTVEGMIAWSPERTPVASGRRARAVADEAAPKSVRQPARRDKEQIAAIREWANSHGYKVSNRGRIPGEVEAAYNAAR